MRSAAAAACRGPARSRIWPSIRQPSWPGRELAATPLALLDDRLVEAGEQVAEHPVADRPLGQAVDLDGQGVLGLVLVGGEGDVDAVAGQEPLDRVAPEAHQVGERHVARRGRPGAGASRNGTGGDARTRRRPGSRGGRGVEGERRRRARRPPRRDVLGVEGLRAGGGP